MNLLKKNRIIKISLLIAFILFFLGGYYMYMQKYQMYIRVTSYDENSSEFPSKKVWFDASEWLNSPQYIKVHDTYLINKKYIPIENLDTWGTLGITIKLQDKIDNSSEFYELNVLKNMETINFLNLMKDKMSYEYIYTKFDEESLKPVLDFFLIKFPCKGKRYELLMMRRLSGNDYVYDHYDFIYKENEWHKHNNNIMTYRDYLAGKIDSYK
ncbi:hypothetical protein FE394_18500 [Xenorhabdus sp. Reich]|uniref:Uncharacterized protein n=1 Tax=Xenorhabdus littoralis TaxID=2582835 RepID=A0ABU4SR42_9GAMM|nr:hypothetical protein [Xenorhabdus sp. Reich]MDX8001121.1 hypothetical protein [Xenorhabdus sp. Reich]